MKDEYLLKELREIAASVAMVSQSVEDLKDNMEKQNLPSRVNSLEVSRGKFRGALGIVASIAAILGIDKVTNWFSG